ncbi:c-type cytochrome [Faucicola boevrei]|uniref:c-type cytochrome n=1 Tax=Faucicola boevrei TaxID=346665 RepID=UPI00037CAE8A|nr:cytochrome c [Moraxella boevrei]
MPAKKILICSAIALTFALVGCNKAEETATKAIDTATTTATTAVNTTASAVSSGANAVGSAVSATASQVANTINASATSNVAKATAVDPNMTPAQHQDAREDIMKQYSRASKALRGMTEDPSKFNADELKQHAQTLSQDPWVHFPATAKGGEAKDDVWTNPEEFQAQIDKYKSAVTVLNTAVVSATSIDAVKTQIADVGASCKSCHTQFKAD